jgi:hypothetical protein
MYTAFYMYFETYFIALNVPDHYVIRKHSLNVIFFAYSCLCNINRKIIYNFTTDKLAHHFFKENMYTNYSRVTKNIAILISSSKKLSTFNFFF